MVREIENINEEGGGAEVFHSGVFLVVRGSYSVKGKCDFNVSKQRRGKTFSYNTYVYLLYICINNTF